MVNEPQYVKIAAGDFQMGSETGRDEERPVHCVSLEAFEIAVTQVPNREYAVFLDATRHPAPPLWRDPNFSHPDQPVVAVSWFDALKYCEWLSAASGRRHRLPTEAEWERAARGGCDGRQYPWGDESPSQHAEYLRRWEGKVTGPLPIGNGTANGFGVYDMCENVHEWCADWFDAAYYSSSPPRDPQGPATGDRRASRGGSWRHQIKASRCSARSSIPPDFKYADYGFRIARDCV